MTVPKSNNKAESLLNQLLKGSATGSDQTYTPKNQQVELSTAEFDGLSATGIGASLMANASLGNSTENSLANSFSKSNPFAVLPDAPELSEHKRAASSTSTANASSSSSSSSSVVADGKEELIPFVVSFNSSKTEYDLTSLHDALASSEPRGALLPRDELSVLGFKWSTVSKITSKADIKAKNVRSVGSTPSLLAYVAKSTKVRVLHQKYGTNVLLRGHTNPIIDLDAAPAAKYAEMAQSENAIGLISTVGHDNNWWVYVVREHALPSQESSESGSVGLDFSPLFCLRMPLEDLSMPSIFEKTLFNQFSSTNVLAKTCSSQSIISLDLVELSRLDRSHYIVVDDEISEMISKQCLYVYEASSRVIDFDVHPSQPLAASLEKKKQIVMLKLPSLEISCTLSLKNVIPAEIDSIRLLDSSTVALVSFSARAVYVVHWGSSSGLNCEVLQTINLGAGPVCPIDSFTTNGNLITYPHGQNYFYVLEYGSNKHRFVRAIVLPISHDSIYSMAEYSSEVSDTERESTSSDLQVIYQTPDSVMTAHLYSDCIAQFNHITAVKTSPELRPMSVNSKSPSPKPESKAAISKPKVKVSRVGQKSPERKTKSVEPKLESPKVVKEIVNDVNFDNVKIRSRPAPSVNDPSTCNVDTQTRALSEDTTGDGPVISVSKTKTEPSNSKQDEGLNATAKHETEFDQQELLRGLQEFCSKTQKNDVDAISKRIFKIIKGELDKQSSKLASDRLQDQVNETVRLEKILKVISNTLNNNVGDMLRKVVLDTFESKMMPQLSERLSEALKGLIDQRSKSVSGLGAQLKTEIEAYFKRKDTAELLESLIGPNVKNAVEQNVSIAVRDVFSSHLIPSMQETVAGMFKQVHSALEAGISQTLEAQQVRIAEQKADENRLLLDKLELLEREMASLKAQVSSISSPPASAVGNSKAKASKTAVGGTESLRAKIDELVPVRFKSSGMTLSEYQEWLNEHSGNLEAAFFEALGCKDLTLLFYLLQDVLGGSPRTVMQSQGESLLVQPLLLSLIHLLTVSLPGCAKALPAPEDAPFDEGVFKTQIDWCKSALLALNMNDCDMQSERNSVLVAVKQRIDTCTDFLLAVAPNHSLNGSLMILSRLVNSF